MDFAKLLTIVFIALKITGHITWPWLLVLSPILASLAIFSILAIFISWLKSR